MVPETLMYYLVLEPPGSSEETLSLWIRSGIFHSHLMDLFSYPIPTLSCTVLFPH